MKQKIQIIITSILSLCMVFTSFIVKADESTFTIPKDSVAATAVFNNNNTITVSGSLKDYPWLTGIQIILDEKEVTINKEAIKSTNLKFTQLFSVAPSKTYKLYHVEIDYMIDFDLLPGINGYYSTPLSISIADPKYVFDVEKANSKKTVASIREKAKIYAAKFTGNPFISLPSAKAPFKPGVLNNAYLTDGLNRTNFYRYLANLPDDLKLDPKLNANAQYGSVLLSRLGYLSHTPPQPKDMPKDFFDKAYEATSSSNLCLCGGLTSAVDAYMDDTDSSNIDRVGHRRWILSPDLKYLGLGMTDRFSAMKVFDSSRDKSQLLDWDYISWPAKGFMPIEYFNTPEAWSVSINPEKYDEIDPSKIQVTMVNLKSKKVWKFNSKMNKYTSSGNYMNVSTAHYGYAPAIIFRPNLLSSIKSGDKYQITISGLKTVDGKSKTLTYIVSFFKL